MSAAATGLVWEHSPYRGATFLVHLAMADVVNDAHGNEFWMAVPGLARKCRLNRRTVTEAIATMVADEYLERLESGQAEFKPSRYRFAVEKLAASGVTDPGGGATDPSYGGVTDPTELKSSELKGTRAFSTGDPSCVSCHGAGHYFGGAGHEVACYCTRH